MLRTWSRLAVALLVTVIVASDALAQDGKDHVHGAAVASVRAEIAIGGEVPKSVSLTLADLEKLPRKTVRAKAHNGTMYDYEGVTIDVVLSQAGVVFGDAMRGKAMATVLVAGGADGYRAVYAVPEIDPSFTDRVILVAFRADGKPLADGAGPLQMIVPDDKRHGRWVRQVTSLALQRLPE